MQMSGLQLNEELRNLLPAGLYWISSTMNSLLHSPNFILSLCNTQLGYVMQVSGSQLSEELRDLLPDYELAFAGEEPGGAGFAAHYYTEATKKLNGQFGDMLYKVQDLEVRGDNQACEFAQHSVCNMWHGCTWGDVGSCW